MDHYYFLLRLIICFILSFLIGLEREFCGSNAGLRTTIIVCTGAFYLYQHLITLMMMT